MYENLSDPKRTVKFWINRKNNAIRSDEIGHIQGGMAVDKIMLVGRNITK